MDFRLPNAEDIIRAIPTGAMLIDLKTLKILKANATAEAVIGLSPLENKHLWEIFSIGLGYSLTERLSGCLKSGKPCSDIFYIQNREDKRLIPVEISLGTHKDLWSVLLIKDLTSATESDYDKLKKLYSLLSKVNLVATTAGDVRILLEEITDILARSGMFSYVGIFSIKEDKPIAEAGKKNDDLDTLCFPLGWVEREYYLMISKPKDSPFSPEEIDLLGEVAHDLSYGLKRIKTESELEKITHTDPLTGLPNRSSFISYVSKLLERVKTSKKSVAVVVVDVDKFSEVNQALGQSAGDKLLRSVASSLLSITRKGDFVARTGSDEFSVVLVSGDPMLAVNRFLERLREEFRKPIRIGSHHIFITFSTGVSIYPIDAEDEESLYANASASVKGAKSMGGNTTVFFSKTVIKATEASLQLRTQLRQAIEREEFVLYYQPKIDLKTGKVVGSEALLRWLREGEIVPPAKFLPVVEEGELIHEIGELVIRKACKQIKLWRSKGLNIPVAINVSPYQLKARHFSQALPFKLTECGEVSDLVEVEITESAIMEDYARAVEFIKNLSEVGIRTYIDDFGTGYSSLAYLKRLPVYAIKIDREFIKDLPHDKESLEIVKAIVSLAKNFNLKLVAEGVETREQAKIVRELGCDYAQGFLFSPPVPPEEFEKLVEERWI